MRHPLDAWGPGARTRVVGPLIAFTLAVMAAMIVVDRQITTPAVPRGIVSFEVAGDVPSARAMLESWDVRARSAAGVSLGLDYLFMLAYSTVLAFGCLWAGGIFRSRSAALAVLGPPLAWGQWLAAVCDGVENYALAQQLLDGARDPWPAVAFWAATPKFVLIGLGILYVIAAAILRGSGSGRAR